MTPTLPTLAIAATAALSYEPGRRHDSLEELAKELIVAAERDGLTLRSPLVA